MARKDDLSKATAQDARCNLTLPGHILFWYQMIWADWVWKQWAASSPMAVLFFEVLWDHMDLNELWEPILLACYDGNTDCAGAKAIGDQDRGKEKS